MFSYIPFYISRYEKEGVSERDITYVIKDLTYFRDAMLRLHQENVLVDDVEILKQMREKLSLFGKEAAAFLKQYGKSNQK